jgi:hypothetical protein
MFVVPWVTFKEEGVFLSFWDHVVLFAHLLAGILFLFVVPDVTDVEGWSIS